MIASLPFLLFIALAGWRVDYIKILDTEKNVIFSAPTALRHTFTTRYIHSVELTPVEDEYRIIAGRLWTWEERVRSTNAGLPFDRPENGRFIESGNWMVFQGKNLMERILLQDRQQTPWVEPSKAGPIRKAKFL